jgi:hypothetical protein
LTVNLFSIIGTDFHIVAYFMISYDIFCGHSFLPVFANSTSAVLARLWLRQISGQAMVNGFGLALAWLGPGRGLDR